MDWGFELYWWSGSQSGPSLLRLFPCLQIFTLVIQVAAISENQESNLRIMETAKGHVEKLLEKEQVLYPKWHKPEIRYTLGGVDWASRLATIIQNK
jgi:hypothetical protein